MLELAFLPLFDPLAFIFQYVTLLSNRQDGVQVVGGSNPLAPTYFSGT